MLDQTTARPNAWKFDVGELLDINSHDSPLVYRWVVRPSPRKYVTAADKVRRLERRLLPAQQRHCSDTFWSEGAWQHPRKCSYDNAPKNRHFDWNHCCLMYRHFNGAYFRRSTAKILDFGPHIIPDMCAMHQTPNQAIHSWSYWNSKIVSLILQCGRHRVRKRSLNHREIEKLLLFFSTLTSQMVVWGLPVAFPWITAFLIHVLQLPQNSFPVSLNCKLIKYSRMCHVFFGGEG